MNQTEFAAEIARLQPTLRSFTHRFTHDREESRDLVQDTLLKALLYRNNYRRDTNLKGWLFTIMRNTFINGYRKAQREKTSRDVSGEQCLRMEETHTFNRPQEQMEFNEIWSNAKSLRDDLLVPFRMHVTGYKYEEIADRLAIPLGTVKNRIFHARKEIQKKLQGYR